MAISLRGNLKSCLLSRLKALINLQRFDHTLAEGGLQAQPYPETGSHSMSNQGRIDMPKWKTLDSRLLGISRSMIPQTSWNVLKILRNEGFEAYLVGGCVRDLLLNKIPKDYDVITTANLKQIKKRFRRAMIVGRRFPICMVHIKGSVIEVSSFETVAKRGADKEKVLPLKMPRGCDAKDFIRWKNSMCRDFTINSLFFDPFVNKIYDYSNGIADLRSLKLRTLIPAQLSFEEDCARILRGLRIAARLGLSLQKDLVTAMHNLSSSLHSLAKARIMMELNYMLAYGAAEPSLCLLHRFNLLEMLLPFHAAYLQETERSAKSPIMLMQLFFHMDKLVTCDRPSDCSLWIGLLAFHLALVNNPQEALVIQAFASALYHGNWKEGVKFSKEHAKMHANFVPETVESSVLQSDDQIAEAVTLLAYLVQDSIAALIETECLLQSMSRYPLSPFSGFVFISKKMGRDVAEIFNVLLNDIESYDHGRKRFEIDYHLLGRGDLRETRFVLGKIILETMSSEVDKGGMEVAKVEKTHVEPDVPEEEYDMSLSDLMKPQIEKDRKHKRGLLKSSPELMHGKVKKQKLVEKQSSLSKQVVAIMDPNVDQTAKSQEVCQKHKRRTKTSQLPPREETNMKQGIRLEKESYHLKAQEVTIEMQEDVENDNDEDNVARHLKVVDKVKHMLSQEKITKKHKAVGRRNTSQEAQTTQKKVIEEEQLPFFPQELVRDKHHKLQVKGKGSRPLLSSFFK